MQGIFVNGKRPASKKAIKEAIAADPSTVHVEATSTFGNEYDGPLSEFVGTAYIVGPDPSTDRRYYLALTRTANGKVKIK